MVACTLMSFPSTKRENEADGADGGRRQMPTDVSDSQLVPCVPAQYPIVILVNMALAVGLPIKAVSMHHFNLPQFIFSMN